jgi:uncharacterized protein (TIGR00297 family)
MLGMVAALLPGGVRLLSILALTLGFTLLARGLRAVTSSGATAGGLICLALFWSAGVGGFLALVTVFLLTWVATRFGYRRKEKQGTAERTCGRTASQVLANLGVAAASALIFRAAPEQTFWLVAAMAALAEAAADTVSSEFGQSRSDSARLITTWESVPAGTDGGITVAGSVAGIISSFMVVAVAGCAGRLSPWGVGAAAGGGIVGMVADSILGATFERKGKLTNDWVNLLSTLVAAGTAILVTVFGCNRVFVPD